MQKFRYFTDKRVDEICLEKGLADYEVFCSPIKVWIQPLFLFLSLLFSCLVIISSVFYYFELYLFLIIYLVISFLIFSKRSNSFVITSTKIVVINPNIFFKNYIELNICDVNQVEINESKNPLLVFFLIFNQSYVAIETQNEYKRFYCAGLDVAGYEECDNLTEKNLDSLYSSLQKKGIETKLHI